MRYTIMIVDDNAVNLRLVREVLEVEGFNVLSCGDAEGALRILENSLPHLILMDIALPGMDGLELTRHLRKDIRMREIKIVALTAFAMKGDRERVIAAGCDGYITKPIDTRKFKEQLMYYLKPMI